jgi:hypothetical protein
VVVELPPLGSVLVDAVVVVVEDVVEVVLLVFGDFVPLTGGTVVVVVVVVVVATGASTCWACTICWSIIWISAWNCDKSPAVSAARALV